MFTHRRIQCSHLVLGIVAQFKLQNCLDHSQHLGFGITEPNSTIMLSPSTSLACVAVFLSPAVAQVPECYLGVPPKAVREKSQILEEFADHLEGPSGEVSE